MSMEMLEKDGHERDYALERLIMLSDGVFAIAITLLALELRPPEHWDGGLHSLMTGMIRPFGAFLFSFFIIAIYWVNHRRMFGRFRSADTGMTILNFLVLGLVTLLPVASTLVAEGGPRSAGFAVYVTLVCGIGLSNAMLWAWAAFARPRLFAVEPPREAKIVVTAVMLVPVIILPILALASSGAVAPWFVGVAVVVAIGLRGLRMWAARSGSRQWLP